MLHVFRFAAMSVFLLPLGCGGLSLDSTETGREKGELDPPSTAKSSSTTADEERFIGNWTYSTVTFDGQPFDIGSSADGKAATIIITKDSWTIHRNGIVVNSTWSIDPSASPKTLTQHIEHPELGSYVMQSIYRFKADGILELCERDSPDKPRPTTFEAKPGDAQFSIILKRTDTSED